MFGALLQIRRKEGVMLKRKRNAAIIESDSESDTDNDENSDYEPEVKLKNSLIKKPKKDSKIKSNAEKPKAKKTSSRVGLKSIDANAINDSSERDTKDGSTTSKRIKKELTKKTSTEKLKAKLNKSTTKAADDEDDKEVPVIADKANQKGNQFTEIKRRQALQTDIYKSYNFSDTCQKMIKDG